MIADLRRLKKNVQEMKIEIERRRLWIERDKDRYIDRERERGRERE